MPNGLPHRYILFFLGSTVLWYFLMGRERVPGRVQGRPSLIAGHNEATMWRQLPNLDRATLEVPEYVTSASEVEARIGRSLARTRAKTLDDLKTTMPDPKERVLYFVTPTYYRATQMVDLTRLGQFIALAQLTQPGTIYWIVIEDSSACTHKVRELIQNTEVAFAHIAVQTNRAKTIHRGTQQRNRALNVVEQLGLEGVVYFGDDDNAYDVRLMREVLKVRGVGIFSMGFAAGAYERCQVDPNSGVVVGIFSNWKSERRFPIDMGAFATSTSLLLQIKARFNDAWAKGSLESEFLSLVVEELSDLEPLADQCQHILSWHTKSWIDPVAQRAWSLEEVDPDFDRISNLV